MLTLALIVLGLPLGLTALAWVRFAALGRVGTPAPPPLEFGIAALSVAAGMWVFVCTWMATVNRNGGAFLFGSSVAMPLFGLISWIFCIAALICSFLRRKQDVNTRPLRNAIRLASACLMLIWLLFLLDVH